jgi:hypothetical protein
MNLKPKMYNKGEVLGIAWPGLNLLPTVNTKDEQESHYAHLNIVDPIPSIIN